MGLFGRGTWTGATNRAHLSLDVWEGSTNHGPLARVSRPARPGESIKAAKCMRKRLALILDGALPENRAAARSEALNGLP